jgi:hypothetical protein
MKLSLFLVWTIEIIFFMNYLFHFLDGEPSTSGAGANAPTPPNVQEVKDNFSLSMILDEDVSPWH